ncbi:MAG TPA: class I SAM-dependent methyltransferase [Streptosporangiaceae bacterium]|nr:class I SAM-dependent methyltransferase [Streptosporangiaceae bacterium]
MASANREQATHWNSAAGAGHWVTNQARHDRMLEPFLTMILAAAAIRSGERVLDVGCGCGATTRAAALQAAPADVAGIDLSTAMLARARDDAQAARLLNVSFIVGDAQVHPLQPASFDVVISRFGVMFFADPVAAFTNLRRATRDGGRLVFACWQPMAANPWLLVPGAALAEHVTLPEPAPPDAPGMFALADPDRVRGILTSAGWREVDFTAAQTSILVGGGGTVAEAVEFLRGGSQARTALEGADPATEHRALASVRSALARHADAEGVHLEAAVWLVRALAGG